MSVLGPISRSVLGSVFPARGFSPRSLFAAGEVGAWYDPSDLTTLFQDDAGTTPVTAAGQRVALMLDKSGRGNHATQSILAQRPTYAVEPVTGRRNLLTFTEDFSNAAWAVAGSGGGAVGVKTPNFGIAPDGTQTACRVQLNVSAGSAGAQSQMFQGYSVVGTVCQSAWIRTNDNSTVTILGFTTGVSSPLLLTVTGSWARLQATTTGGGSFNFQVILRKGTTSDTADLLVWNPQAELGSTATAYQRVVTAQDVSEAGVAARHYLFFDGIDDGLLTGTITPGADKAQVFAGVRKLSDAARGTIAELTASAAANNGAFHLTAPNAASTTFAFESKGTSLTDAVASGIAAPATRVLAGLGDIAGDTATLRVNGVQADQDTGDQGTGNYAAAVLYLGRRGGASLPFSGHLYGAIVRFSSTNLGAAQITAAERWMAQRTGVTL